MTSREGPSRRSFLVAGAAVLGGCLGGGSADETSTADADGYPSSTVSTPAERSIDTDSFARVSVDGTDVPLAPIDAAYYWYLRREARFADARGESNYERSHVRGAVLSPAPDGGESDPVTDWPTDDRVVCYCGCPHHLSSIRAANLIENGYEEVYVIDEGFWEWHERGYPMAGEEITAQPAVRTVRGLTAAADAGATAWAWHEPSGQREATRIDAEGRYVLELRFTDVTPDSILLVETPSYRVRAPLADLVAGPVTGADPRRRVDLRRPRHP